MISREPLNKKPGIGNLLSRPATQQQAGSSPIKAVVPAALAAGVKPGIANLVPPSTVSSGISAAPSAYPSTQALLSGGSQEGITGLMSAAPSAPISDAAALGQHITSGLNYIGVGPETAGMVGTTAGYAIPAVTGTIAAYDIGKDLLKGKKMGTVGGATKGAALGGSIGSVVPVVGTGIGAAAGAAAGAGIGALLGQFGHSKNYWDGKSREDYGALDPSVSAERFRKDPTTYNYDQSKASMPVDIGAGQALAYLTTEQKPGDKLFNDVAGGYANLRGSKSAEEIFGSKGYDHDKAYAEIANSDLDDATKSALLNGLDQTFGVGAYGSGSSGGGKKRSGGGGKKKSEPSPAGPTPSIQDLIPKPITAPVMPQPDDEPSPEEIQSVSNYQQQLENALKRTRSYVR